jgi:DNA-binding FadR family transcriptional regulator
MPRRDPRNEPRISNAAGNVATMISMTAATAGLEREGEVERVYRLLKGWILDATLRPGDFLSEVARARQCETSRTPVREACNLLSQEKWIQRIRHKGYVIPPISIREIIEVYEYRKLLECFCAERAAASATPEGVRGLARADCDRRSAGPGHGRIPRTNQDFHIMLGGDRAERTGAAAVETHAGVRAPTGRAVHAKGQSSGPASRNRPCDGGP